LARQTVRQNVVDIEKQLQKALKKYEKDLG
jgi:hypothetical protein